MDQELSELQSRLDELLAGKPQVTLPIGDAFEGLGLFSAFDPRDMRAARGLTEAWMDTSSREEDELEGLRLAIDAMYAQLGKHPHGMVEYAAKLFLTHSGLARKYLRMRSLEERQPNMVRPSTEITFG